MNAGDRFRQEMGGSADQEDGADLPTRLAQAASRTLGVDAAGVSLLLDRPLQRLPLASSDPDAALAEQLQFTTGDGPCLTAHDTARPVFGDDRVMRDRWPVFTELLRARTPFRAVASLPLRHGARGFGALDLYLVDPDGLVGLDVDAAVVVAGIVGDRIGRAASPPAVLDGSSPWFDHEQSSSRVRVWQAVGMVSAASGVDTTTALANLRAFAYARSAVVDAVSRDLVEGTLDIGDLVHEA